MRRLKPEKKRLIASIIAGVLIVAMLGGFIVPFLTVVKAEGINSDITVEAIIGFDGNVKIAGINNEIKKTKIDINIRNNGDTVFKGNVSVPIRINSFNNDIQKISSDIEINPKSEKLVTLYFNAYTIQNEYNVIVNDEKGKEVNSFFINAKTFSEEAFWVGFLTENQDSITYLKPEFFSTGAVGDKDEYKSFFFDEKNFPNNSYVLRNLNAIIIAGFDVEKFSEQQVMALKTWVANGGKLVCSNEFKPYIFQIFGDVKEENLSLNNLTQYSSAFNETDEKIYPLINVYSYENGKIYFNDFQLNNNEELLNSVVISGEFLDVYTIEDGTDSENFIDLLSYYSNENPMYNDKMIIFIAIIIFGYIVFIGFGLFEVLKKRDIQKNAIFIIPVISVGFTVFIYLLSFNTIYKRPLAVTNSYIDTNNSYNGNVNIVSNIKTISPDKGKITMEMPNEYDILNSGNNTDFRYFYAIDKEDESSKTIREINFGDTNKIIEFDKEKWGDIALLVQSNKKIGNIDMDIAIEDNIFKGTITNNTGYDLEDVIVGTYQQQFVINSINNGDSVQIGEGDYTINLNNYSDTISTYILTDGTRTSDKKESNERLYQLERRQDIFNGIINNSNNNVALEFYVIGFNDIDLVGKDIKVNNKIAKNSVNNVFVGKKVLMFDDFNDNKIPFGIITPDITENGYIYKDNYNDNFQSIKSIFVLNEEEPVELSFYTPSDNVCGFELDWNDLESQMQIYNNSAGSWEDCKNQYNQDYESYINQAGEIKLKIKNINTDFGDIQIPKISFKLSE